MSTGGSSSTGGGGNPSCSCEPGEYCLAGSGQCRACDDFSFVGFGAPQKLTAFASHPVGALRFPRPRSGGLLYRAGAGPGHGGVPHLWYAPDRDQGFGVSIANALTVTSGPLAVEALGSLAADLIFDEAADLVAPATLMVGTLGPDGIDSVTAAGEPLNPMAEGLISSDYSVAVASQVERAWWMSTRNKATAELVTAKLSEELVQPVVIDLPTTGGSSCRRTGSDATVWVTPDGTLMLFRAFPVNESCSPVDGDATDLYAVLLNSSTGMPVGQAVALSGVNVSVGGSTETDPAFSEDLCWLYFASDGGEAGGYEFELFRAPRQ